MQENQKLARCHRFRRYTLPRFFDASAAGGVVRAWGWAHRRGLASVPLRLESVMCALVLVPEAVGARGGDGRWRDRCSRRRSGSRTCCRQFGALARCLEGRLGMQISTVIRQCRYIQSYGRDPELAASINTARTYCYCTPVFPDHHPVSDTRVHHA